MQVEHIPFLMFFHHKKIHGENSSSILPSYRDTFSLVANKRNSHIPNRNLGMALILTVNSNHPVLLGLIADSLHLSLWMFFPIHRITWSTMAGCLRFAIWLCILFKAVLSKYQSGVPSGCLSVCLWRINLKCQCQPLASS